MADGFCDWADVCAFALTLPEVTMEPHFGVPAPKVGGKAFVARGHHEEATSFVLMAAQEEKLALMEIAPDVFWQTPHYAAHATVLVRYGAGDRDWLEDLIRRAWWDRAPKRLRVVYGARP